MEHWVLAFVGDHARENCEATQRSSEFCVTSEKTPIRRARPGDRALLYLAGEGFVAEVEISSTPRAPYGAPNWSSKKPPLYVLSVARLRRFAEPIPYRFPGKGHHPTLGFHRYSLTGGFLAIPRSGFEDVLGWAYPDRPSSTPRTPAPEEPAAVAEAPERYDPRPRETGEAPAAAPKTDAGRKNLEKRVAGQHALSEGRKRAALWTVAEIGASALKLRVVERFAQGRVQAAEKTWIAGGKAEERGGAELEKLRGHGFYVFHDVPLPGIGNVDHVVLGRTGFYSIETKSHKGLVSAGGGGLLVNGCPPEKDFVKQAWRGCYRLREILGAEVTLLLLFTDAHVKGRVLARGVRVLPLPWLVGEVLRAGDRHDLPAVKAAVNALSAATGCYPSAAPRPA